MNELNTPLVLIIFNRPDKARRLLEIIEQVKPKSVYIIADGPRSDIKDDEKLCHASREVFNSITWKCDVLKRYADSNLGLRKNISSGLTWVFSKEESAIILEDDCVPTNSFFPFCETLLNKYNNDSRIMAISGNNFQAGKKRSEDSYYFSKYFHCWGWATWKRAWEYYDDYLSIWEDIKDTEILNSFWQSKNEKKYWTSVYEKLSKNQINSWAYRWAFSIFVQHGLCIIPNVNLVTNVGFGDDATNTKEQSRFFNMERFEIDFPLKHPKGMIRNFVADEFTQKTVFHFYTLLDRVILKVKKILGK